MTALAAPRVVHVLNTTDTGGAEMVALHLATRMRPLGWTPEVLALRGEGALSPRFADAGIPVTNLRVAPRHGVLRLRAAVAGWLAGADVAVVHTHNVSPLVAVAMASPRRRAFRFVHTKHGRARATNLRGRFLTRWAARRTDALVAVSKDAFDLAVTREGYPSRRMHLVYNGIDLPLTPARMEPPGLRLVTAARLEPIKTMTLLLEAVSVARAGGLPVELDVVGDGSERAALEEQADTLGLGGAVRFAGWQRDIGPWLQRADAFVLASRSEGLSMTVLEAMAHGLPVIATRVGGNPEVIVEGVTGTLVPHGDVAALAHAIRETLTTPDRAAAWGASGRRRVETHFTLDGMAASYDRLYRG
jgi:glycosyltransferase involved in cell wall biosynthesis